MTLLLCCILVVAGTGRTTDPGPAAELRSLLARYDAGTLRNTIPVERAILALGASAHAPALAEFVAHPRFGTTALWALARSSADGAAQAALAAFRALPDKDRPAAAPWIAFAQSAAVREELARLAREPDLDARAQRVLRLARLRAGDRDVRDDVRRQLAAQDGDRVAQALLLAGDARAMELLGAIASLLDDPRTVEPPLKSAFAVEKRVVDEARGRVTFTKTYPELPTVGAVALEAANRVVRPSTPEYIAWWYELEKGARFTGDDARSDVRAYAQADEAARAAGALPAAEAVERVLAHLRSSDREVREVAVRAVRFAEGAWTVHLRVDGREAVAHLVDDRVVVE